MVSKPDHIGENEGPLKAESGCENETAQNWRLEVQDSSFGSQRFAERTAASDKLQMFGALPVLSLDNSLSSPRKNSMALGMSMPDVVENGMGMKNLMRALEPFDAKNPSAISDSRGEDSKKDGVVVKDAVLLPPLPEKVITDEAPKLAETLAPKLQRQTGPFSEVKAAQIAQLVETPAGKSIPPLAEIFENNALRELGPEPKPSVYVSKDPTDNKIPKGATAYRTIAEAVKNASPGTVIQVMPGVYKETINLGPDQSNIALQTDRQNPAVIDGGSFRIGSGAHDISIRNFDVRNFSGQGGGIKIDGQSIRNITIAGNDVHDARGTEGIAVYGRSGTPVSGIKLIGNRVHDLRLNQLEAMPINGNVDGVKVQGNSGFHLDNLFIDAIGGEGKGGNQDQPRNITIAYNFADGISSKQNPSYNGYSAGGIYSDGGRDLEIYGNYVRNSDYGIEIASEHRDLSSSRVNVYNNIFESSHLSWLKLGYKGGVDHSEFRNNLVIGNRPDSVEIEGPVDKSTVRIDNNINSGSRRDISKLPSLILNQIEGGAPVQQRGETKSNSQLSHESPAPKQMDGKPDADKEGQRQSLNRRVQNWHDGRTQAPAVPDKTSLNTTIPKPDTTGTQELPQPELKTELTQQKSPLLRRLDAVEHLSGKQLWKDYARVTENGNLGCAISVSKALQDAGVEIPDLLSVVGVRNYLVNKLNWTIHPGNEKQAGDVFYGLGGAHGHIGIVGRDGERIWNNSSPHGRRWTLDHESRGFGRFNGKVYVIRPPKGK